MATFILLTAGQAAGLRGPSISMPSASLDPVERQGGVFILGAEVLADPAHEAHWQTLGALPQLDGAEPGFPLPVDLPEE